MVNSRAHATGGIPAADTPSADADNPGYVTCADTARASADDTRGGGPASGFRGASWLSSAANGGNCYEPGEWCRNADHNSSGVAGDGKAITCEDNDGWRWEPS